MYKLRKILLIYILVLICGICFKCVYADEEIVTLETIKKIGEELDLDVNNKYNNTDSIKVYKMLDKNDKLLYCLEPGKHAFSNDQYRIFRTNGYLASAVGILPGDQLKVINGPYAKEYSYFKVSFLRHIISYIYNTDLDLVGYGEEDKIVAKQILIWHYIKLTKDVSFLSDFNITSTMLSDLRTDAAQIYGSRASNYLYYLVEGGPPSTKFNGLNDAIKNFIVYLMNGTSTTELLTYTDEFCVYVPITNKGGDSPEKKQILIGPPYNDNKDKYYSVIYRLWDQNGLLESKKVVSNNPFISNGRHIASDTYTEFDNKSSNELQGGGIGDNEGNMYTNHFASVPFESTCTVYFDYKIKGEPAKKHYSVVYRFWKNGEIDTDRGENNSGRIKVIDNFEFTGDFFHSAGLTYTFNDGGKYTTYNLTGGSYVNPPSTTKNANGVGLITFSNDGTVLYFDYETSYVETNIKLIFHYTNSSGKEINRSEASLTGMYGSIININLGYSVYNKNYYVNSKVTGNGKVDEPQKIPVDANINTIPLTITSEGGSIVVDLYYKSKKVNVQKISIHENGSSKTETVDGSEINVMKSWEYTGQMKYDGLYYFSYYTPSGAEHKSWSEVWENGKRTKVNKDSKLKLSWNGQETTVYTFKVYYEERNLYKNACDSKCNVLVNGYIKKDDKTKTQDKALPEFSAINPVENYFSNIIYSKGAKYVFDKNKQSSESKYIFGRASSTINSSNTVNNRYNDANNNAKTNANSSNLNSKKYSDIVGRSLIDLYEIAKCHSDTTIVNFLYEVEQPINVYVRHIVKNKDGTYTTATSSNKYSFLVNANERYKDTLTGKWKAIENGYSQRNYHSNINSNVSIPYGFSEYFVIDKDDNLKLDRSRTLLYDGVQYNCVGYIKTTDSGNIYSSDVDEYDRRKFVYENISISKGVRVQVPDTNNKECGIVYYVDFYYEEEDYSNDNPDTIPTPQPNPTPDPTPDPDTKYKNVREKSKAELRFESQNEGGKAIENNPDDSTKEVAYVPASEYIKPYFKTASYIPYQLVYELTDVNDENGTGNYNLKDFYAYQLNNETIVNKSMPEDVDPDSLMLGETKYSVINTNSSTYSIGNRNTGIAQAVNNKDKYSSDKVKLFSTTTPSIDIGTLTGKANFNGKDKVNDDKYNGIRLGNGTVTYKLLDVLSNKDKSKTITFSTVKNMDVNVYTPMSIDKPEIKSTGNYVNHSDKDDTSVIQKDTEFTLTPKIKKDEKLGYNENLRTLDNYLKGYLVVFDFNVRLADGRQGNAGEAIEVKKNEKLVATPIGLDNSTSVNQLQEKITTIAVTINASNDFEENVKNKMSEALKDTNVIGNNQTDMMTDSTSALNSYENYGIKMNADSLYFVRNVTSTYVLARLYDFKVTDCYDVNYKNVFRTFGNTNGTVNGLTGINFYSGKNKLRIDLGNNIVYTRSENTILPLGPYKHTQKDYIKAPKLGYRISFDVKTFGYYDAGDGANKNNGYKRTVEITPSYYYISKDGKTFKNGDEITLYYKNSSGKYVTFNDSSYSILFKPNDGYRNISNGDTTPNETYLSDKMVNINIGKSFNLDSNTMMTTANNNFIQAWYGEYKVPNSTIVVEKNGSINNPLKDGYLGVIFKIKCVDVSNNDNKEITVMYDQNDRTRKNEPNTTEWDYEGYMGVTAGKTFSGSLQLEKGKWSINDDLYQKIKGTVVLYDLDDRAANDFD